MPARSKKQWRWMWATHQPFARRWAYMQPYASLPAAKDDAAAPAHGPGGLLATPGLGVRRRRWGARLKAKQIAGNLYRGDDGKFQAGGGASASSRTAPQTATARPSKQSLPKVKPLKTAPKRGGGSGKGKKPAAAVKKPPKTAEERQAEQAAKRAERDTERRATRDKVLAEAGIDANTAGALTDARDGNSLTSANGARLASMGLAEQSADGSYRLSAAGRQAADAAAAGDAGRVNDTLSKARDTAAKRADAAAQPKKGDGGGGKAKPSDDEKRAEANAKKQTTAAATAAQTSGQSRVTPQDVDALRRAADGAPAAGDDTRTLASLGFVDNTGQATDQGRRALSALERGDIRQYNAAVQDARNRMTRESATAQRQQETARARSTRESERQQQAQQQLQLLRKRARAGGKLTQAQRDKLTAAGLATDNGSKWRVKAADTFAVFKDASGSYRWLARTTTAYRDRDGEIISTEALDQDSQRMMATKQFGPLRWWHVGAPDPHDPVTPWGPGLDIGDCDYSVVIGRTRIESGTFRDPMIAQKMARVADGLEMSPGFFHPESEPDTGKVFHHIRTFERSPVPTRYGRASNLFTGFTVKESQMKVEEMERRFKAMINELGLDATHAAALADGLVQTEKAAAQQGIAFKSQDAALDEITINGVVYTVKAAPPPAEIEAPVIEEQADDTLLVDDIVPEGDELDTDADANVLGNLSPDEFFAMLDERLAPVLKMQDMLKSMSDMHGELKSMMGGVTTKDDSRAQELAALKAQQDQLAQKIAAIEGNQPSLILPDQVQEAFKSAGPATPEGQPDPEKPVVPDDPTRPLAGLGAKTFPELYTGYGPNGWVKQP